MVLSDSALREKLKSHLVDTGLTYTNEGEWAGVPVRMRPVVVDKLVSDLLDYLIGEGYVLRKVD